MVLPVIAILGAADIRLESTAPNVPGETRELDCRCYSDDSNLEHILVEDRPHVIVTVGEERSYGQLMKAPYEVRKRWVNFSNLDDVKSAGAAVYNCFLNNALLRRERPPLVSVFTPTYRTGDRIMRPLQSLLSQTYTEWEWIILDDSGDEGRTFQELSALARRDHRITVFRSHRQSGRIGEVKQQACRLASGDILLELDHDDELTDSALTAVVSGFQQFPEAGFAYTNWAEVFEDGRNATYGESWAFDYGRDHYEEYNGRTLLVHEAPRINPKTIRHIVSAPNHIRAWKRDCYWEIGGHSTELPVADDFALCVNTFLCTRMVLIPKLCYIQYYNEVGNTQRARNKDIQRLTRYIRQWNDSAIHKRFCDLGVDDFVWNAELQTTDWSKPNPAVEPHCSLVASV